MEEPILFSECRACLLVTNKAYAIFENNPESSVNILAMLKIFSIQVDENSNLPNSFCEQCYNNLVTGYTFFENFQKSQIILRQKHLTKCNEEYVFDTEDQSAMHVSTYNYEEGELDVPATWTLNVSTTWAESEAEKNVESFIIKCEDNNGEDRKNAQAIPNRSLTRKQPTAKISEDITPQKCPYCSRTFRKIAVYAKHVLRHNKPLPCKICTIDFNSVEEFASHHQIYHRYYCNICNKPFRRSDVYHRHMKMHSNSLPQFPCPIENCSKNFSVRQSLRKHLMSVHSDARDFLCNLCGASFKNYDNLRYHIKKHKGPSHLCTHCGKAFMQAVHLTYHMWRHTGIKPFKCEKCHKSFAAKKVLNAHLKKNCHLKTAA